MDKRNTINMSLGNTIQGQFRLGAATGSQSRTADKPAPVISQEVQRKDACSGSDSQNTQPGVSVARKRRVHAHFNDLQECCLQSTYRARQAHKQEERDCTPVQREGYHPGLKDFQSVLSSFTRYRFIVYCSRLRVVAELKHEDLFNSATIVSRKFLIELLFSRSLTVFFNCSIEFDRDDELFATAGVS
ncbi:hypothetical protein Tco_1015276 [Tanacetum coccineum]|uniref:Uncharacterized protein n=1 Tax=Tanacetum coccineum TaxID=301880 RepID=A0ABQ5FKH6_9ASTR